MINTQSTLRTAPDLCKNVSFAVLFGNNGNSYAVSTQSDIYVYVGVCACVRARVCICLFVWVWVCVCVCVCVKNMCMYTLILHNVETLIGNRNKKQMGQPKMPRAVSSLTLA